MSEQMSGSSDEVSLTNLRTKSDDYTHAILPEESIFTILANLDPILDEVVEQERMEYNRQFASIVHNLSMTALSHEVDLPEYLPGQRNKDTESDS
jgi:hypothetical protein